MIFSGGFRISGRRFLVFFLAGSEFSGSSDILDFFSGGHFFPGGIPNFLAVTEFPGGHLHEFSGGFRTGANAAVFISFPTTGSGLAGRGPCQWVGGSNPTF